MHKAIHTVIDRHGMLRTSLSADGQHQQTHDSSALEVRWEDLSGEADPQRALQALLETEARHAFDLCEPLLRFALFRLAPNHHVLLSALHLLVCDGVSLGVVFQDLRAFYVQERTGISADLPPPLAHDVFLDHRTAALATRRERVSSWWRAELGRPLPPLELPLASPRPPRKTFEGGRVTDRLDAAQVQALHDFAKARDVTHFMALFATFSILMHRLSGQREIGIGVAFGGRDQVHGSERTVGLCSRLLPVRCRWEPDATVSEYVRSLRAHLLDVYEHQDQPLEELLEWRDAPRDPSRLQLIDVVFNWDRYEIPEMHGLEVRYLPQPIAIAARDLMPTVFEVNDELVMVWDYNRDLFSDEVAQAFVTQFRVLLDAVSHGPDIVISKLPLEVSPEASVTCNDTAEPLPLLSRFAEQVANDPDRPAVIASTGTLSFGALDAASNRMARWLQQHGVAADVPVALHLDREPDAIVALLAILKAGGAAAPLPQDAPVDRLQTLLDGLASPVAICSENNLASLGTFAGSVLCPALDEAMLQPLSDAPLPYEGAATDLAYIIHTSGSTARPRGVMVTRGSASNLVGGLEALLYHDAQAPLRVAMNGPLAFDTSVKQWLLMLRGHSLVLVPAISRTDPMAFMAHLEANQVDVLDITPSQLRLMVDAGFLEREGGPGRVLCGGEAIDAPLWDRLRLCSHRTFFNLYGPTECTVDATVGRVEGDRPVLGVPVPGVQLHVLDPAMQPVPAGSSGELFIGGRGVARGYWDNPELTAERFLELPGIPGRVYRTGDLVRRAVDGALEFLGRLDRQVKLRGHRIEPEAVSATLREHPSVRHAHAGVVGEGIGKRLAIWWDSRGQLPAAEARSYLMTKLPAPMVPSRFAEVHPFPLSANGKLDTNALPNPEMVGPSEFEGPPATPLELELASVFSEVAGGPVGVGQDFFMAGGSSIDLPRLALLLTERTGRTIPVRELFRHATPRAVASWLEPLRTDPMSDVAERLSRDGFAGPLTLYSPDEARSLLRTIRMRNQLRDRILFDNAVNYDRHFDIPELAAHISHPSVVAALRPLLGPDVLCWRTEFFPKFPGDPGTEWHQVHDYRYATGEPFLLPTKPQAQRPFDLTVWTAFTAATIDTGCMRFMPGTHRRRLYDESLPTSRGRTERYASVQSGTSFYGYDFDDFRIDRDWDPDVEPQVSVELEPGQAVIFTARCVHGSHANRTERSTRFAISSRYVSTDVRVYPNLTRFEAHGSRFDLADYGCVLVSGDDTHGHNRIRSHDQWGHPFPHHATV